MCMCRCGGCQRLRSGVQLHSTLALETRFVTGPGAYPFDRPSGQYISGCPCLYSPMAGISEMPFTWCWRSQLREQLWGLLHQLKDLHMILCMQRTPCLHSTPCRYPNTSARVHTWPFIAYLQCGQPRLRSQFFQSSVTLTMKSRIGFPPACSGYRHGGSF